MLLGAGTQGGGVREDLNANDATGHVDDARVNEDGDANDARANDDGNANEA